MTKRWKPEVNDPYWVTALFNDVVKNTWLDDNIDENRWESGNCFKTKEEAEAAAEKVKALLLSLHGERVTEGNQLQKLTAEVFNHPDCPMWAKYAAVDESGRAYWYASLPKNEIYSLTRQCVWHTGSKNFEIIPGKFDASNWERSLIERPAKLPDWCKVGEWGYDTEEACYFEIVGVTPFNVDVAYTGKEWRYNIGRDVFGDTYKPARLRPYNEVEMKALVGNTVEYDSYVWLVIGYNGNKNTIFIGNGSELCVQTLMSYYKVNGKPAGIFEHLENGVWVK